VSSSDWYFAHEGLRAGPVSSADLKQLAGAGTLRPEDLVWREGMNEWIAASKVRGLFDAEGAVRPSATPPAPAAIPTGVAVTLPVGAPPLPAAATAGPAATVARASPAAAPPAFEPSAAVYERSREKSSRHLLDLLLDAARAGCTPAFVAATTVLFTACGHYGLYLAMLLSAALGGILAVMGRSVGAALAGLGFLAVLVVLQYVAGRFLRLIQRLNRATPAPMALSALPDCFALLCAATGLIALLALSLLAAEMGRLSLVLPGVAAFIVCLFMAVVALNPATLWITVTTEAAANEEALGNLAFLLKVLMRAAPVAFGVGVAWGVARLVLAYILLMTWGSPMKALESLLGDEMRLAAIAAEPAGSTEQQMRVLAAGPAAGLTAAELAGVTGQQMRVVATGLSALQAGGILVAAAALPIVAYTLFLLAHLGLEVLRGLALLPDRLDQLDEPKDQR
jgi:hypothetical protein